MSIKAYDLKSIEGKTIGVYERADENIRRLKVYLESNNINCNLKYYHQRTACGRETVCISGQRGCGYTAWQ